MTPITRSQRVLFFVIFLAALLVAVLGLFAPAVLASIFDWLVLPPLHARFVGAIYAYGAAFMLGCLLAHYQGEVHWASPLIAVWTGMLFIISALHLSAFDFTRLPVWVWFASYSIYPVAAIVIAVRRRDGEPGSRLPGRSLPDWASGILLVQGVVVTLLAAALLFAPHLMAAAWPWPVTPLLAQTYAGPLLSYGLGSLLFARERSWLAVRAVIPAMLLFTAATLAASISASRPVFRRRPERLVVVCRLRRGGGGAGAAHRGRAAAPNHVKSEYGIWHAKRRIISTHRTPRSTRARR